MAGSRSYTELRRLLEARRDALREEIREQLLETREKHFIELAGQVRDLEDASVADLLVDIDLSLIDRHLDEARDVDTALLRLRSGTYGTCVDCGDAIDMRRLHAFPTAKRCLDCQQRHEGGHAGYQTPSL